MKLLRYGDIGSERPGRLDEEDRIRDLGVIIDDIDRFALNPDTLARIKAVDPLSLPKVSGTPRVGACVARPEKFIGIGLNYYDHAVEMNMDIPKEPVVFLKSPSCICGPFDPYEMPRAPAKLDWEVELGVVIGTRAKNISQNDALAHVAGYCVVNDGSERIRQLESGGQWTKGKSHDSFGPLGPWLVTRDALPDTGNLWLRTQVDGQIMQDGSTGTMIFSVPEIIAYLSSLMTLMPGDVIATGTPPGVGTGKKPEPTFLKTGQTLELEIERLGVQRHKVVDSRG